MLKSEIFKAAKFIVLSLEYKAEIMSAVSVFKATCHLFKALCGVYLAVSKSLSERTVLMYFYRTRFLICVGNPKKYLCILSHIVDVLKIDVRIVFYNKIHICL